jgi:hypothetical protein
MFDDMENKDVSFTSSKLIYLISKHSARLGFDFLMDPRLKAECDVLTDALRSVLKKFKELNHP